MRTCFLLPILSGLSLAWAAPAETVPKPLTAAVLDFQPRGVAVNDVQGLSDRFRVELFLQKRYRMLEREKMDEVLKEQGFQKSGACEQSECAVEVGKLLGVNRMVIGSVNRIGSTWTVTARTIDVETGEIVQTAVLDQKGEIDALLQPGMQDLAEKLQESEGQLAVAEAPVAKEAKPAGAAVAKAPKSGESVVPMPDFKRPWKQFGKSGASSSPLQLGLVPGIQVVDEANTINGVALSLPWSRNANVSGVQAGVINQVGLQLDGVQAGVVNLGETVGFLQAGAVNQARTLTGFQGGVVNISEDTRGMQVGLFNYSRKLKGVQVGLINVATKGGIFRFFPFVNLSSTR